MILMIHKLSHCLRVRFTDFFVFLFSAPKTMFYPISSIIIDNSFFTKVTDEQNHLLPQPPEFQISPFLMIGSICTWLRVQGSGHPGGGVRQVWSLRLEL
jgi:hypothetical protein